MHEEFLACSEEHPADIPQADFDEMLRDAHERDDAEQSEQERNAQVLNEQTDRDYYITTRDENKQKRVAQAKEFFDVLYGHVTGDYFAHVCTLPFTKFAFFKVSDEEARTQMAEAAIRLDEKLDAKKMHGVYVSVNLQSSIPKKGRGSKDAYTLQVATVTDIDAVGGAHVNHVDEKTGKNIVYLPDFDTAKSLIPFQLSMLTNTGYGGLQGYAIYREPIVITADNHDSLEKRGENFIDCIRSRAGIYVNAVDNVQDIPRLLRVPGTRNCKVETDSAPMCRLVEVNDVRFSPDELDEKISVFMPAPSPMIFTTSTTQENSSTMPTEDFSYRPKANVPPEILELRGDINATVTPEMLIAKGYLTPSPDGAVDKYCCPWCGSPHSDDGSAAMHYYADGANSHFTCFSLAVYSHKHGGDVFSLIVKVKNLDCTGANFYKSIKEIADEFDVQYDPTFFDYRAGYVKRNNSVAIHDGSGKSTEEIIAQIRDRCEWRAVKVSDGDGKPQFKKISIKPTQANLNLIFGEDPNLRGLVGHDQFCGVDIFLKRAPWHDKDEDRTGEQWNDTDNAQLRVYLRNVYADLEHEKKISDTRIDFARKNSFNAVKQFLSSLPKWDGEKRAETVFVKFLHAEDSEYTRVVTLNFLLGSIARVYYPGVEFANCPVLQGAQRIGKSRLIRMLGGKEGVNPNGQNWHVALKDSVDDSHATDALMKGWIIEIEEFSAARKAEVNNLKTFISATEDTRRFTYDKYATTRQRKNSFVVTCNDSQIFRDKTGNARFIVVKCSQKKFDRVPGMTPEYIRQVWAEALHIYNEHFNGLSKEEAGAKLLLPLKIQEQAEAIAEKYTQDDGMTLEITSYLDRKIPLQAIWLLLTKERRRKFIADGKIEVDQAELNFARRAQGGRNAQEDIDKIDSYLHGKSGVLKQNFTVAGGGTQEKFILFGTEYRQHICAAEIFQECFGQDKRKSMTRINEILTTLDGWTEGRRLQKADPEYNDQKHPYYRDEDNLPVEETEESKVTDFVGTPFDLEKPPF